MTESELNVRFFFDLERNGLVPGKDCIYFELTSFAMVGREGQEVDLGLNWLRGCGQNHGLMVRYVAPEPRIYHTVKFYLGTSTYNLIHVPFITGGYKFTNGRPLCPPLTGDINIDTIQTCLGFKTS